MAAARPGTPRSAAKPRAAARKRPAAGPAPAPAKAARKITVRMYNVGFGDCFLVEFPRADGELSRVLVDCGTIASAQPGGINDSVETLLADVTDADGHPRIDVVVCTHRHADHVSGFSRPAWRELKVREVWFPWTEDPQDPAAARIRNTQSRLALALQSHWQARLAANGADAQAQAWLSLAVNALSNAKAMQMLHSGFSAKPLPRYLHSDGSPVHVDTQVLPGVKAYVLGPSKSKQVIRDMNPPAGTTFLRQMAEQGPGGETADPFAAHWHVSPERFQWPELAVSAADRAAIQEASQAWTPAVAVALEKAVNGTSLVLVFEIDGAVLFFPGDAQWGTWEAFMGDEASRTLLKQARFWKVGHHGSHNATPVEFVRDTVARNCCAMISTRTGKFTSIPRGPLLEAIAAKGLALARSDEPENAPARGFGRRTPSIIEAHIEIGPPT